MTKGKQITSKETHRKYQITDNKQSNKQTKTNKQITNTYQTNKHITAKHTN